MIVATTTLTLTDWLLASNAYLRVGLFIGFFLILAWAERKWFWRTRGSLRMQRWGRHLSLTMISKVLIRLTFPVLLIQTAAIAEKNQQGILHQMDMPYALKVVIAVFALDLFIYAQHCLMHRLKWFWALHKVHHIDKELDISTGIRFHPLEELVSMSIKLLAVAFLGAPIWAAFIFEVVLNFFALFTHANMKLSKSLETKLRWFIVTPGMHRIHHSDIPRDYNTNYGFCFSGWDKLFRTYRPDAFTGEKHIILGQEPYRDEKYQTLKYMLLLPFNFKSMRPYRRTKKLKIQMGAHDD